MKERLPAAARYSVRIDSRATFRAFYEEHGGDPVMHGERLLFRDGWTHSATDHRGPEWPPPSDPAKALELIAVYWRRRHSVLAAKADDLREAIANLEGTMRTRSSPLMQQRRFRDEETGRVVVSVEPVSIDNLRERLAILVEDAAEAKRFLDKTEAKERRSGN